jgi:hypothetical protein
MKSGVEEDFVIKVDERQFNRQTRHKVGLALASLAISQECGDVDMK